MYPSLSVSSTCLFIYYRQISRKPIAYQNTWPEHHKTYVIYDKFDGAIPRSCWSRWTWGQFSLHTGTRVLWSLWYSMVSSEHWPLILQIISQGLPEKMHWDMFVSVLLMAIQHLLGWWQNALILSIPSTFEIWWSLNVFVTHYNSRLYSFM